MDRTTPGSDPCFERRAAVRAALVLVAAFLTLFSAAGSALAREAPPPYLGIGPVSIQAEVNRDGSMFVVEERTYRPTGAYTFAYWELQKTSSAVVAIGEVAEVSDGTITPYTQIESAGNASPGTYLVRETGDSVIVYAYFRNRRETATFRLTYTVVGATQRWSDAGELLWQFVGPQLRPTIGPQPPLPINDVTITIQPPTSLPNDQVLAWVHGPLNGQVAVQSDGAASISIPRLARGTLVEVRVLYPEAALSSAPVNPQARRQAIVDEEARLAEEASAQRAEADKTSQLLTGTSWALAIVGILVALWAFMRYGRDHKAQFAERYLRGDPRPDLPPAVVGALVGSGGATSADLAATILDMAVRGLVKMDPEAGTAPGSVASEEAGYRLSVVKGESEGLTGLDADLCRFLVGVVGTGDSVVLNNMETYAKANARTFVTWMREWRANVAARAQELNLLETTGESWRPGLFAYAALVTAVGIAVAGSIDSSLPLIVALPAALVIAAIAASMSRWSPEGTELQAEYAAVRNYLEDFPQLEDVPTSAAVWNRLVVLAVVFGMTDKVLAQIRTAIPEVMQDPAFQAVHWWTDPGEYGRSPVAELQDTLAAASRSALSFKSWLTFGGTD